MVEDALEVAVLIAVAMPFLRLAVCRAFIRRLGGAPEMATVGVVALAGYLVSIAAVALISPILLRPLVAVALALAVYAWWRARPSFGVARGLPYGSLRLAPVGPWVDQDYFARDVARFGPIFKTTTFLAPTVCIVGLPAALDLFARHDASLQAPTNRFSQFIPRGFVRFMSDEDHASYAPILRSAVSGAVIREAGPELALIVRAELEAVAAAGRPVRVGELTRQIGMSMFLRLFFGIGQTDRDLARLKELYRRLDLSHAWRSTDRQTRSAVDEICEIVGKREVAQSFLTAAREAHGDRVDDATAMKNIVYMCQTGASDTSGLIAWVVWMLTTNREWVDRLRESSDPKAARRVVQESTRMEQSEYILRKATERIEFGGFVIPRGWRVRVLVRESHRDPAIFPEPEKFNPDRFLDAPVSRTDYSPFGAATTRTKCLGEGVTLTCGRIVVEELVRGFEWTVTHLGKPEYSGVHWRPSSSFAIGLSERAARPLANRS